MSKNHEVAITEVVDGALSETDLDQLAETLNLAVEPLPRPQRDRVDTADTRHFPYAVQRHRSLLNNRTSYVYSSCYGESCTSLLLLYKLGLLP